MGSSKDHFSNLRVSLLGSLKYFHEYLRENENILGYYSRGQVMDSCRIRMTLCGEDKEVGPGELAGMHQILRKCIHIYHVKYQKYPILKLDLC